MYTFFLTHPVYMILGRRCRLSVVDPYVHVKVNSVKSNENKDAQQREKFMNE